LVVIGFNVWDQQFPKQKPTADRAENHFLTDISVVMLPWDYKRGKKKGSNSSRFHQLLSRKSGSNSKVGE